VPALRGKRGHQGVVLILVPGSTEAGLHEFARLAAREVEDLAGDEAIEHDHIGGLQHADRAHCEQVWIGRDVDDGDRSIFEGSALPANGGDQMTEVGFRRFALGVRHRVHGEEPPEGAARGECQPRGLDRRAPMLRGRGPGGKARGQQHFQLGADRLREDRCRAVGGNANDQGRAVDDGAESEVAEFRSVDDVNRNAGRARSLREASRVRLVGKRAGSDSGGLQIARDPLAPAQNDRAARRSGGERVQLL
jgi:hypothetical protein